MKLATIRKGSSTVAVRVQDDAAVELGVPSVGDLLQRDDWRTWAGRNGQELPLDDLSYAPLIPSPDKIICVGLNYRSHIWERQADVPSFPTLFAKLAEQAAVLALKAASGGAPHSLSMVTCEWERTCSLRSPRRPTFPILFEHPAGRVALVRAGGSDAEDQ